MTRYQEHFGVDPMPEGPFGRDQIRADMKDIFLVWTKCLRDLSDRTKYPKISKASFFTFFNFFLHIRSTRLSHVYASAHIMNHP